MKKIVLAGGCFWGVEAFIAKKGGVAFTKVGYSNGITQNPTYEEVCSSKTGFAEACYVEYDEKLLSLEELLTSYWRIIDPTVADRQGHDIGNQYRTGIYYYDEVDVEVINSSKRREQLKYEKTIVTEIEPVKSFYGAEEYHQKYLIKNPKGYCHIPLDLLNE
ncbi:MAG: peptide-methionine (S)-S-oxide reductase MsrA [Clostridiaceae bacterium]|nr:peptide-methionine (S)-S-oxide reductase MsrA [Clostridiaceae bacterium]